MIPDAVVIGAGIAGMAAAIRIGEAGGRVTVLAKGIPSLYLRGGTIDILGYAPQPVDDPIAAITGLTGDSPGHPYALLGAERVETAAEWLASLLVPWGYTGSVRRNVRLPTALGAARPSALVPESMAAGSLGEGGRFLVVGLRGVRDFYPGLVAGNLSRIPGVAARAVELALPGQGPGPAALAAARALEDAEVRKRFAQDLAAAVEPGEAVALPAVLGLVNNGEVWRELQELTGGPLFEIPTPPPSVPGMRLFAALRSEARRRGVRLLVGTGVAGVDAGKGRVQSVEGLAAGRRVTHRAGAFVLATGSFQSGGLELDRSGAVREPLFGLDVQGGGAGAGEPSVPGYFGPHPVDAAGLRVDELLRPLDAGGGPRYANLFAVGGILAGAAPWREKSAEGIGAATALAAAEAVIGEAS